MWMGSLFSLRQSRCARRGAKRCRAVQCASFRPCGAGVYHQQLRMAVQCYSELYGRLFRSCSDSSGACDIAPRHVKMPYKDHLHTLPNARFAAPDAGLGPSPSRLNRRDASSQGRFAATIQARYGSRLATAPPPTSHVIWT
jgi:hypothetical protein